MFANYAESPMKTSVFCAVSLDGFIARADDSIDWLKPFEAIRTATKNSSPPSMPSSLADARTT